MTDEEMAEERAAKFTDINFNESDNYGSEKEVGHFSYCAGFLAGLRVGRPQWHDLRKNPKDLPRERVEVLNEDGDKVMYDVGGGQGWITYSEYYEDYIEVDEPIAWCEIPKYMKED